MNILIINVGSSSIKYQLLAMPNENIICEGMAERIGNEKANLRYKSKQVDISKIENIPNHKVGLQKIAQLILDPEKGVIKNTNEIYAVAHRVVHGGNSFSKTTLINDSVKQKIKELAVLAPLHNPVNLVGIELSEKMFPEAKQIAIFDTAFHQTIPQIAKQYAIPNKLYTENDIQVYGFHGTSHKYVSEKTVQFLKQNKSRLITIHLGNGCSITAIKNGKSIDHSMGFAPSNGLIMGSRSGDIDHALIFYLVNNLGYQLSEVKEMLDKKSGMYGLTGYSDLRDIQNEAEKGNTQCILALEMNAYRIKKYIGAYTAAMNGLDAIVFTAGIGENSSLIRKLVCSEMEYLGIVIDMEKNESKSSKIRQIHSAQSKVKILVTPTNEELEIAKQAYGLLTS
ncbi:acetate/propionate family kinase [Maribacter sp. CXY002]|uniref:acetate/propionate family kinase n=1 Tax=Maribacter luteocoastalis TaxID=3407671 RepID=UPI003B67F91C